MTFDHQLAFGWGTGGFEQRIICHWPVGEPFSRGCHVQGLVGTPIVVFLHPGVDRYLSVAEIRELASPQQFGAHRAVEPFHFPGRGGGAGSRQPWVDAVLAADPLEQHLTRPHPPPPGEGTAPLSVSTSSGTP